MILYCIYCGLVMFVVCLSACTLAGSAIWSLNFVALSGLSLETPDNTVVNITLSLPLSISSLVVASVFTFVGLWVCSLDSFYALETSEVIELFLKSPGAFQKSRDKQYMLRAMLLYGVGPIMAGGVFAALGIIAMQYVEALSIQCNCLVVFNGGYVFLSVLLAGMMAVATCWVLFRLLSIFPHYESLRALSALAISGLALVVHFSVMGAATFVSHNSEAEVLEEEEEHGEGAVDLLVNRGVVIVTNIAWNSLVNYIIHMEMRNCYRNFVDTEQVLAKDLESGKNHLTPTAVAYSLLKTKYRVSARKTESATEAVSRAFSMKRRGSNSHQRDDEMSISRNLSSDRPSRQSAVRIPTVHRVVPLNSPGRVHGSLSGSAANSLFSTDGPSGHLTAVPEEEGYETNSSAGRSGHIVKSGFSHDSPVPSQYSDGLVDIQDIPEHLPEQDLVLPTVNTLTATASNTKSYTGNSPRSLDVSVNTSKSSSRDTR